MKIKAITVGKKHDPKLIDAINDYEKRLKNYCEFTWEFVPNSDMKQESEKILKLIKQDDFVILLDERGRQVSNKDLSRALEYAQNSSFKQIVIIIGGSYGVTKEIGNRAKFILSLSPLVFPHQIVRLLLVEQIYRSYSILNNAGYHHK